jgi:hypothetical protein
MRLGRAYRRDLFAEGLKRHGFEISDRFSRTPSRGDVLLLWNRPRSMDTVASGYARAGGRVIIAENGYLPHGEHKQFALALDHHNGRGRFFPSDDPRLIWPVKPWREAGDHILILAQRGIGELTVAQPFRWPMRAQEKLRALTSRPIRIRQHPGQRDLPLEPDLDGAHAVITWGSGSAIKAIVAGIPCFFGLAGWIGADGALPIGQFAERIESPFMGDRAPMLARISWAQWSGAEIASGAAFERLLACQ